MPTTLERIGDAVSDIEDHCAVMRESLGHLALQLIDVQEGGENCADIMRSLVGELRDELEKTRQLATTAIVEVNALRQAMGEPFGRHPGVALNSEKRDET